MSKLLFKLSNVPDDEACDIRELLANHNIDYYETNEGRWRVGISAIWLNDSTQYESARAYIDTYQQERYRRSQAEQSELSKLSLTLGIWQTICQRPMHFLMTCLALAFILVLTILPFLLF